MQLLNDLLLSFKASCYFCFRLCLGLSDFVPVCLCLSIASWPHFVCVSSCVWDLRTVIFHPAGHIGDKAELLFFFSFYDLKKFHLQPFNLKIIFFIAIFLDFLFFIYMQKFWIKCRHKWGRGGVFLVSKLLLLLPMIIPWPQRSFRITFPGKQMALLRWLSLW